VIETLAELCGYLALACAAGAAVSLAIKRKAIAEGFDSVEQFFAYGAVGGAMIVAGLPFYEWSQAVDNRYTHATYTFQADGQIVVHTQDPGPPPSFGAAGGHFLLWLLGEFARELVVGGLAFGIAWSVVRLVRPKPST
jgi:hypothetical protein